MSKALVHVGERSTNPEIIMWYKKIGSQTQCYFWNRISDVKV